MKPNTLRTEIFLLPQPPHRFYSKADCAKDQSTYGIDLSDAIHAALNGLALAGKVDWEEVGSDLIDMAIDVLEGTTKHPPESQVTDTPSDDAANYWGTLQDKARNRVGELLLIADTYLLPYIPAIRKVGQVVAMESFRAFLKHTYEVQLLMEPKDNTAGYIDLPKVWNSPLSEGTDINSLPATGKYWFPCNQHDLEIAPVGHDVDPQSLAKAEVSLADVAAAYQASRDGAAMTSPIISKIKGYDPEAWLIYVFTQLDGSARQAALGITPVHYSSLEVANEWYVRLGNELNHGRGECSEAFDLMTAMYHRMSARDLTADQVQLIKTVGSKDIRGEWDLLGCTHAIYTTDTVLEAWYESLVRRLQPVGTYTEADLNALGRVRERVNEYYNVAKEHIANNTIPPDLPATDPLDPPLVFFTSRHAELIYKLTQLQGAQRCNELGITREHYVDAALASRWYFDIASKLQGTGGGLSVRALREATRIYKTLIDTESLRGSSQSMVTAMETNGCLPTGEF